MVGCVSFGLTLSLQLISARSERLSGSLTSRSGRNASFVCLISEPILFRFPPPCRPGAAGEQGPGPQLAPLHIRRAQPRDRGVLPGGPPGGGRVRAGVPGHPAGDDEARGEATEGRRKSGPYLPSFQIFTLPSTTPRPTDALCQNAKCSKWAWS